MIPCRVLPLLGALVAVGGCGKAAVRPVEPPAGPITFEDVAAARGIRFRHFTGADGRFFMPESVGSGGALFDYDGDGRLDVYLVNCTSWPDRPRRQGTAALYRNEEDGTFRDVTREAGLAHPFFGMGCAVGDFDNDGRDDLLLTGVEGLRLYRNTGGRFREVTPGSGLDRPVPWPNYSGAAWVDYDRDGRLDLYVCRYVDWSPRKHVVCKSGGGKQTYCGPNLHGATPSVLFRNLGGGRFQDVSAATGIARHRGKGLGVLPVDVNDDGWPDLMVTNDTTPNHLFLNEAGRRFRNAATELGVAVDENGRARAGMGVDVADLQNDGGLAFTIGNFSHEGLSLYRRSGPVFMDAAPITGLAAPSLPHVTFGVTFLDADQDGLQDLFIYNGHVDPQVGESGGAVTYRQRPQLFRSEGGAFREIGSQASPVFSLPQSGRGCAAGDFDNDGKPDLLLCENGGPARLLRNTTADNRHWLGIRLVGTTSNRNAYGSEVRLTAGGVTQRRWVRSGGSYLTHGDTRALFGLGQAAAVERVEIRWPSGRTSTLDRPQPDRYHTVTEPR